MSIFSLRSHHDDIERELSTFSQFTFIVFASFSSFSVRRGSGRNFFKFTMTSLMISLTYHDLVQHNTRSHWCTVDSDHATFFKEENESFSKVMEQHEKDRGWERGCGEQGMMKGCRCRG